MELKFNIGSGLTTLEGYSNIDWGGDILLSGQYDGSVGGVYTSHFVEYFDESDAMSMLQSWNKKMKPGATLHIAVPDFKGIVTVWQEEGIILSGPLYGKMESGGETIYHKSCYCFPKLRDYLLAAGFRSIRRHDGRTLWPDIEDCAGAKYNDIPISLNLSAIK